MNVGNLAKWVDELAGSIEQLTRRVSGMKSTEVEVTQVQESGTKIATVTVNEEGTDIYAPEVVTTQVQETGEKIATVSVDGVGTDIYSPNYHLEASTSEGRFYIGSFSKDNETESVMYLPYDNVNFYKTVVDAITSNNFVVPTSIIDKKDNTESIYKTTLAINCYASNTVTSVSLASDMTDPANPVPLAIKAIKDIKLYFVTQSTGGVQNYGLLGNPNARNASVTVFNIQKAATGETTISFKPTFQSGDSMTVFVDIEYTLLPVTP